MNRASTRLPRSLRVIRTLTLTAAFQLTLGAKATGQVARRIEIPDEPSCARCSVELKPLGRLASNDSVSLSPSPNVVRDKKGRLYVMLRGYTQVGVFGANGKLQKLLGGKGRGPGEFSLISRIEIVRGDTLLVFDAMLRRVNVLSPTHEFVRFFPMPVNAQDFAVVGSHYLIFGDGKSPSSVGQPLHLFTAVGVHERSFGVEPTIVKPGVRLPVWRIAPSLDLSSVWAAPLSVYEIAKLNERGQSDFTIVRRAAWFPPHDTISDAQRNGKERMPPGVLEVAEIAPARLLVILGRSDLLFGKVEMKDGTIVGRPPIPITQLEVIDIATQKVVARSMVERPIYPLSGDMLYSFETDSNGEKSILLWQVVVNPG